MGNSGADALAHALEMRCTSRSLSAEGGGGGGMAHHHHSLMKKKRRKKNICRPLARLALGWWNADDEDDDANDPGPGGQLGRMLQVGR
jgi:hypothetical protein